MKNTLNAGDFYPDFFLKILSISLKELATETNLVFLKIFSYRFSQRLLQIFLKFFRKAQQAKASDNCSLWSIKKKENGCIGYIGKEIMRY